MAEAPLDALRQRCTDALLVPLGDARLSFPEAMRHTRIGIERQFSTFGTAVSIDRAATVLKQLYATGVPHTMPALRDCLYAVGHEIELEDGTEWGPISDPVVFDELLEVATSGGWTPRQKDRFAAALAYAYFDLDGPNFGRSDRREDQEVYRRWCRLPEAVAYLVFSREEGARPSALAEPLARRRQVLVPDDPTSGWPEEDRGLEIGIPADSWFWRELIVGRAKRLCSAPPKGFRKQWLSIVSEALDHDSIADEVLGLITDRYVRLDLGEDHDLRTLTLERWGNPFEVGNEARWRAHISGEAFEEIRGWIAVGLIDDFFDVLTQRGTTDTSRPRFWRQYGEYVTDVRFYLGRSAIRSRDERLLALRRRMGSAMSPLSDGTANAFAMRIGKHYYVEFSEHGKAAYVYDRATWSELADMASPSPADLRWKTYLRAINTMNQWTHHTGWQAKFAGHIAMLDQVRPRAAKRRS